VKKAFITVYNKFLGGYEKLEISEESSDAWRRRQGCFRRVIEICKKFPKGIGYWNIKFQGVVIYQEFPKGEKIGNVVDKGVSGGSLKYAKNFRKV
jgi:hypothetical protein